MKKIFLLLFLVPAINGYTVKIAFSDGIKHIDTAELDQFESPCISSLVPLVHKLWAKNLKKLDYVTFDFLSKLSKLDDAKLFNFFLSRKPEEMKLLYFNIRNYKIDNKLHLAASMAMLKNRSLNTSQNIYQFDADQFSKAYLYDYFAGKVFNTRKTSMNDTFDFYDRFFNNYYGNINRYTAPNFFTSLLHYHDQVLKKPMVIDTPELKQVYMNFDAQIQNHLVNNKFVTLT